MQNTSRLGLWLPEEGDATTALREAIEANAQALDSVALDDQGPLSSRPVSTPVSPGKPGRYYFATDNQVLYRDHGTGWTPVTPETGTIEPWPWDHAGDGWLLCDGSQVTLSAAPVLRAALISAGSPFGSAGGNPLTPAKGDFFVNRDTGQSEFNTIGERGGQKSVSLTPAQTALREHEHHLQALDFGGAPPSTIIGGDGKTFVRGDTEATGSGRGIPITTIGSFSYGLGVGGVRGGQQNGSAHTNLPPYTVVNYRIHI